MLLESREKPREIITSREMEAHKQRKALDFLTLKEKPPFSRVLVYRVTGYRGWGKREKGRKNLRGKIRD